MFNFWPLNALDLKKYEIGLFGKVLKFSSCSYIVMFKTVGKRILAYLVFSRKIDESHVWRIYSSLTSQHSFTYFQIVESR